MYFNEISTLD